MTSNDTRPPAAAPEVTTAEVPVPGTQSAEASTDAAPARRLPAGEPVLPEQSPEDTDAAWGEYPERADDRLSRDRPPHWDNF
ncbi:MAG TPA: hypothetical protein VIZ43_20110 [Trebonia sp.]